MINQQYIMYNRGDSSFIEYISRDLYFITYYIILFEAEIEIIVLLFS